MHLPLGSDVACGSSCLRRLFDLRTSVEDEERALHSFAAFALEHDGDVLAVVCDDATFAEFRMTHARCFFDWRRLIEELEGEGGSGRRATLEELLEHCRERHAAAEHVALFVIDEEERIAV